MGVAIDKCTKDNILLTEGDCATDNEINDWIDKHMVVSFVTNDFLGFSMHDGAKPVFQKFSI